MDNKYELMSMEKWSFNNQLFRRLPDVLDISGAEIARRCSLKQQVLNRYQNGGIVLSVQVLIKICNSLRMPAYYFVAEDGACAMPNRESATVPADDWQTVTWNWQAAELTFGDGEGKVYWKDVAEVMGVSSQKPHEWFLLKKRFPIDCFFKACNAYNLSPFRFLTDPNRKKAPRADMTEREELNDLRRRFVELSATVDDLKRKYGELLKSHEQLVHRVQVNINTISGGNISNIGITADPLAPPDSDK